MLPQGELGRNLGRIERRAAGLLSLTPLARPAMAVAAYVGEAGFGERVLTLVNDQDYAHRCRAWSCGMHLSGLYATVASRFRGIPTGQPVPGDLRLQSVSAVRLSLSLLRASRCSRETCIWEIPSRWAMAVCDKPE